MSVHAVVCKSSVSTPHMSVLEETNAGVHISIGKAATAACPTYRDKPSVADMVTVT